LKLLDSSWVAAGIEALCLEKVCKSIYKTLYKRIIVDEEDKDAAVKVSAVKFDCFILFYEVL
jgi:hypothetical protein